jgi:hypothetical protein
MSVIKHSKNKNKKSLGISNQNKLTRSANFSIIISTERSTDIILVSIVTSGCSGA